MSDETRKAIAKREAAKKPKPKAAKSEAKEKSGDKPEGQ